MFGVSSFPFVCQRHVQGVFSLPVVLIFLHSPSYVRELSSTNNKHRFNQRHILANFPSWGRSEPLALSFLNVRSGYCCLSNVALFHSLVTPHFILSFTCPPSFHCAVRDLLNARIHQAASQLQDFPVPAFPFRGTLRWRSPIKAADARRRKRFIKRQCWSVCEPAPGYACTGEWAR